MLYTDCPRFACNNIPLFREIFFGKHTSLTSVLTISDSTGFDIAGPGSAWMNWLRYYWHQHYGHTPATQWTPGTAFGGDVPGAAWMLVGGPADVMPAARVVDDFLLPGWNTAAATVLSYYRPHAFGATGLMANLNHRNGNQTSWSCGGGNRGFNHFDEGENVGIAAFASGSMDGGKSLIDVPSGLRAQVLAVTDVGSDASVYWEVFGQENLCSFVNFGDILATGTLFGGAQSLDAANGTAYIGTTGLLPTLSGPDVMYSLMVSSNTIGDISKAVQVVGSRFVSENKAGLVFNHASQGGATVDLMTDNHSNGSYLLDGMDDTCTWIRLGLNEQGADAGRITHPGVFSASEFESSLRNLVGIIRASRGSDHPIVLESTPYKDGEITAAKSFAGAMFSVAQDTSNICFINSRLTTEQDHGWGRSHSQTTWLTDGLHHTNEGARALALGAFTTLRAGLLGVPRHDGLHRQGLYR